MASINMEKISDQIAMHCNIFVAGIIDSISIHKTLPILVNNKDSKNLTFQVLAANLFLLLGSILVFRRGISPVMNFVMENVGPDDIGPGSSLIDRIMWFIYQTFWLLPVCGLCYACSALWYQELADATYKQLKGVPKNSDVTKSVGFVLYATLVWLFMFIQVQLLCNIGPMMASQLVYLAQSVLGSGSGGGNVIFHFLIQAIKHFVVYSLYCASFLMQLCGSVLMCVLYGWYGFDPQWIAANVHPDTRFSTLERHWAYFIGFGFPYVLIIKSTSFFVGYGVFLALFPFCIMLGSVSDYKAPYVRYTVQNTQCDGDVCSTTQQKQELEPLRVFALAKKWTLSTLKRINKSSYESLSSNSKNGVKTGNRSTVLKMASESNKTKTGEKDKETTRPKGILKMGGAKSKAT